MDLAIINLDRIQDWIDQGRIDPSRPITVRELAQSKCIHKPKEGVKLLARGINAPTFTDITAPSPTTTTETTPESQFQMAQDPAADQKAKEELKEEDTATQAAKLLKQPIHLVVSRASASAIAAVEAAGGSVTTRFYTKASIRRIMKRETHPFASASWAAESGNKALHAAAGLEPPSSAATSINSVTQEAKMMAANGFKYRLPDPTKRRDIEYYRDPAHRGYLSHLLQPLEGPSLFFRSPVERKGTTGPKKEKALPENRLW